MTQDKNGAYIGSKVPQKLKALIKSAILKGPYLNSSEFVRHAVKEKLIREGFLFLQTSAEVIDFQAYNQVNTPVNKG
jgi:hypothetical protein